jgi:hypothetical protein
VVTRNMLDCPDNISIEECLKRQLQKSLGNVAAASNNQSTTPLLKESHSHKSMSVKQSSSHSSSSSGSSSHSSSSSSHSGGKGSNATSKTSSSSSSSSAGGSGGGGSGGSSGSSWRLDSSPHSKGGVVLRGKTIIVKSNFQMAGRLNQQGKRLNAKTIGSHASASLTYMDNHGAKDLEYEEGLANTYDKSGERMSTDDLDALNKELNEGVNAFRRMIIDIGSGELERDDLDQIVRETMQNFQEKSGKDFEYVYAIHTDTDHTHAHVLSYGDSHEINMTKEHLQLYKEIVADKTEELLNDRSLEHDRDLTFQEKIDLAMDGVLDNHELHNEQSKSSTLTL